LALLFLRRLFLLPFLLFLGLSVAVAGTERNVQEGRVVAVVDKDRRRVVVSGGGVGWHGGVLVVRFGSVRFGSVRDWG